jgi:hypothetical protein
MALTTTPLSRLRASGGSVIIFSSRCCHGLTLVRVHPFFPLSLLFFAHLKLSNITTILWPPSPE